MVVIPVCSDADKRNGNLSLYNLLSLVYQPIEITNSTAECQERNENAKIGIGIAIFFRMLSVVISIFLIYFLSSDKKKCIKFKENNFFKRLRKCQQIVYCSSILFGSLPYVVYAIYIANTPDFYKLNYMSIVNDRYIRDIKYFVPALLTHIGDVAYYVSYIILLALVFLDSEYFKKCKNFCKKKRIEELKNNTNPETVRLIWLNEVRGGVRNESKPINYFIIAAVPFIIGIISVFSCFANDKYMSDEVYMINDALQIPKLASASRNKKMTDNFAKECYNSCFEEQKSLMNIIAKSIENGKSCEDKATDECRSDSIKKAICWSLFQGNYKRSGKSKGKLSHYGNVFEISIQDPIPIVIDDFFTRLASFDIFVLIAWVFSVFGIIFSIIEINELSKMIKNCVSELDDINNDRKAYIYILSTFCVYIVTVLGNFIARGCSNVTELKWKRSVIEFFTSANRKKFPGSSLFSSKLYHILFGISGPGLNICISLGVFVTMLYKEN